MPVPIILAAAALVTCHITDGDTLWCKGERVRITGIDAPELPGHCAQGRHCAPGDGFESKASLERIINGQPVRLDRLGQDHYGRTLAVVYVGPVNLACAQLSAHQAIFKPNWDPDHRIANECMR